MIPLGVLASARVAAAGSSWTPTSLASLLAWYDAGDTATITQSGGLVSQWADKSGNGYHATQSTAGSKPTTGAVTVNSLNALSFDGGDTLALPSSMLRYTNHSIFMVCNPSSGTNGYLWFARNTPGGGDQYAIITKYGTPFEAYYRNGAARFTIGSAGTSGMHAIGVTLSGTSVAGRFDGAASGSGTTNSQPTIEAASIGSAGAVSYFIGTICEVVLCGAALSGTDLTNLETYLMTKWGIA